jgi:transposase
MHQIARAVIYAARRKLASTGWLASLLARRDKNVVAVAVALANKSARIVWAILAHDREFRSDYAKA